MGIFSGVESANDNSTDRLPPLFSQPAGDFYLAVEALRTGQFRKGKTPFFVADLMVVEGPEGCDDRVSFMAADNNDYFLADAKRLGRALAGADSDVEIDEEFLDTMFDETEQPAAGILIAAQVYAVTKTDDDSGQEKTFNRVKLLGITDAEAVEVKERATPQTLKRIARLTA